MEVSTEDLLKISMLLTMIERRSQSVRGRAEAQVTTKGDASWLSMIRKDAENNFDDANHVLQGVIGIRSMLKLG